MNIQMFEDKCRLICEGIAGDRFKNNELTVQDLQLIHAEFTKQGFTIKPYSVKRKNGIKVIGLNASLSEGFRLFGFCPEAIIP